MSVKPLVLTDIMTDLRFIFLLFLLEIDVVISCSFVKKGIMGIFDMFKSPRDAAKEEIVEVPWHVLATTDQLDEVVEESKNKPVAIFKHSTRCGISRGVLKSFEKDYNLNDEQLKLYFLDLLQNRDISNQIASRFKVRHESPQLIVIKEGAVVHHDSHNAIDASHLEKFV
tara:strand:- start:92528 stop:93037 length:510 start_codon:yes stop_codon:yes gene_type:complete